MEKNFKFKILTKGYEDILHTAQVVDDTCVVTWEQDGKEFQIVYPKSSAEKHLENKTWGLVK